ncbi:MAG: MFS transporter, partial [Actinomycetota bacterium]|nr:MFS transporter [Actinomycetota bacterium]
MPGRMGRVLTDVKPLQASRDYRRLWVGNTVSQLGQQMTAVTIAIQVYALTHSTFSVGLVGLFALFPLVAFGLYGGSFADAVDRRKLALVSSLGLWVLSLALVVQAVMHLGSVAVLYAVVAMQAACFAVNSPTRSAIVPRLIDRELLPAANALNMASFNLGFTTGPLLGALAISAGGYQFAYAIDAVTFLAALYSLFRLPPIPPQPLDGQAPTRPGLRSVVEGFRFLATAPNLRMTFIVDMCAMVLAQPRALFPAVAGGFFGGGVRTVGLLQASPAIGSLLAFAFSGWVSKVRRQGRAVVLAVFVYGAAVAAFGLARSLWVGVLFLAMSGGADMISAAYRSTILQVAAPDNLRGRLQGVFTVVVAGGPRMGDFVMGSTAALFTPALALGAGGIACMAGVVLASGTQRGFLA